MNAAGANQGPSQDTPHSLNALLLALLLLLASLQEKKKKGCRRAAAPPRYSQRAAALSFLCAFYSFWSSYRRTSSFLSEARLLKSQHFFQLTFPFLSKLFFSIDANFFDNFELHIAFPYNKHVRSCFIFFR